MENLFVFKQCFARFEMGDEYRNGVVIIFTLIEKLYCSEKFKSAKHVLFASVSQVVCLVDSTLCNVCQMMARIVFCGNRRSCIISKCCGEVMCKAIFRLKKLNFQSFLTSNFEIPNLETFSQLVSE